MIIDFNKDRESIYSNLTLEDIFDLFLAFHAKEESTPLASVDVNVLMMSLARYKNSKSFSSIYKNIPSEKNESGFEIINLEKCIAKSCEKKSIIVNPTNDNEFCILLDGDSCEKILSKYNDNVLKKIGRLMFFVNMDLEHGIDNWSLVAEDEFIELPNCLDVVTGEFIDKNKENPVVQRKIKKRAIEHLKNSYK